MDNWEEQKLIQDFFYNKKIWNKRLDLALDIGEQLIISGAEVSRVEDSIKRIIESFGCNYVAVLTITTSIIVTIDVDEYGSITQTRRIGGFTYDMNRLEKMNDLSRKICYDKIDIDHAIKLYKNIISEQPYSLHFQVLFFMGIAFTFTLFFGGSFRDAIASMIIAIIFKYIEKVFNILSTNKFLSILISSLIGGILAMIAVRIGVADSVSKISIGDIMILIPGVALTNSIRDLFSGDTITGYTRFIEAVLVALMIAFGFVMASVFYNSFFSSDLVYIEKSYGKMTTIIIQLITSFFGAISYAGSFNVKKKRIFYAGLGGFIGWATYIVSELFVANEPTQYLFAVIIVNIYAEKIAVLKKVPTTVFLVSSIMPLVPGSGLYETMALMIQKNWSSCGIAGVKTISIALAIAFGVVISKSILHILRMIKRFNKINFSLNKK